VIACASLADRVVVQSYRLGMICPEIVELGGSIAIRSTDQTEGEEAVGSGAV